MLLTPSCLHTRARPLTRQDTRHPEDGSLSPSYQALPVDGLLSAVSYPISACPNLFHPVRLLSTFPHPPAPSTSRPPLRFPSSPARFHLPGLRARVPSTHCPPGSFLGRFVPADHYFSTSSFDSFSTHLTLVLLAVVTATPTLTAKPGISSYDSTKPTILPSHPSRSIVFDTPCDRLNASQILSRAYVDSFGCRYT